MYRKTILLPSGSGTIAVMKWIKNNPELALKLDHTFFNETNGYHIGVCSLYAGNSNLESAVSYLLRKGDDRISSFEYEGMRRAGGEFGVWYFEINNNVYIFTE